MSFLIAKPALADPAMPRWVRWLAPLLSGVFTVDNLDYVRRDAFFTARLFERGPRGAKNASGRRQGLGLYIVRRVMELHGGSVEIERSGPEGTTMRLVINQSAGV